MFLSNANKRKIYYLYYTNPLTRRITSKSCKTKLKSEAIKFLKEFKVYELQNNIKKGRVNLRDAGDLLFPSLKDKLSFNTYRSYFYTWKIFCKVTGNKHLSEVSTKDIEQFKSLRLNIVKDVSVNIDIRNLKSIFNKFVSLGLIEYSKLNQVKEFKIISKKFLSFSHDEIKLIIDNTHDNQIKNIIRISLLTANRISETLNLKWKDIDFETKIISVYQIKTNSIKYIPVTNNIENLLKEIIKERAINGEDYLFHKPGLPSVKLRADYVSKNFKKSIRILGLKSDFKFHSLRHTAITKLLNNNIPIAIVKEIAGHKSITTTMLYTHINIDQVKKGIETLDY